VKKPANQDAQSERFKQAARELGCDDFEERFADTEAGEDRAAAQADNAEV
jgi:hypothetical protein